MVGRRGRGERLTSTERERLLIDVGRLYRERVSVQAIAKQLSVSRSTVQKVIDEAKSAGYIIDPAPVFRPPQNAVLENQLRRTFRLRESFVVTSPTDHELMRSVL